MDNNKKRSNRSSKKPKKKKIIILSVLAFILIIAAIGIGYAYALLHKVDTVKIDKQDLGVSQTVDEQYKDVTNIALFGIDATDNEAGRSDAIMILTIDNKRNNVRLSSIMRDSYVNIKGHGEDKITHAYAFGGPELAISTLNTNFDLNIKDFATVNFSSLPKVINDLNGIDINLTSGDLKYINGYIDSLNKVNNTSSPHNLTGTGVHHLDGTQALAYCRIRYDGGDQERTQRQRTVLDALFQKIKATNKTKYPSILNELLPLVQTSLSSTDLLKLATNATSLSTLEQDRFPRDDNGKGATIKGVFYETFDKDLTTKQMHDFIFEDKK
ncbi:LCP family protein [Clostridium sp. 'White wine YQ']|uniref:LCP family protein n=1 Tax=Clostridium sp. 'White wine YQ' TaxID=3027474 RepID=UPI002366E35C|nr:LCP family protein [Clostridium sp. 'White wine YQ']MDD7794980.1 LCP family protein [Clostridium sp. 'White wine YQ']